MRATLWCNLHNKLPTVIAKAPEPMAPTTVSVLLVKLLIRITAMMATMVSTTEATCKEMVTMVSMTEATCKEMVTTVPVREDIRRTVTVRLPLGHSGLTAIPQQKTIILAHPLILAFTSLLTPHHAIIILRRPFPTVTQTGLNGGKETAEPLYMQPRVLLTCTTSAPQHWRNPA